MVLMIIDKYLGQRELDQRIIKYLGCQINNAMTFVQITF